jgi:pilus assembly protein CpaC
LKVSPEVSSLDFANALTVSGFTVPAMTTRRAETEVELKDGQSFGIAGLMDRRTTAQFNKVPGIGDIPILGQLFRSRQLQRSDSELLVLVTPTIVDPLTAAAAAPQEPKEPLPNLDNEKFDRSLGTKDGNQQKGKQ